MFSPTFGDASARENSNQIKPVEMCGMGHGKSIREIFPKIQGIFPCHSKKYKQVLMLVIASRNVQLIHQN